MSVWLIEDEDAHKATASQPARTGCSRVLIGRCPRSCFRCSLNPRPRTSRIATTTLRGIAKRWDTRSRGANKAFTAQWLEWASIHPHGRGPSAPNFALPKLNIVFWASDAISSTSMSMLRGFTRCRRCPWPTPSRAARRSIQRPSRRLCGMQADSCACRPSCGSHR